MNNFFEILRGGINTTFQDAKEEETSITLGVPSSGAMDTGIFSYRIVFWVIKLIIQ